MQFWNRFASISMEQSIFLVVSVLITAAGVSGQAFQQRAARSPWMPATATWYGDPYGDGSVGGACGYGPSVSEAPLKTRVGAVSPVLFMKGEGCGSCFKVRCLDKNACSRRAVTVIVTDECPGGGFAQGAVHFDLSGAAFNRLAIAGEDGVLRNRGFIQVKFQRTPCTYGARNIAFRINEGSTPYWLSLLVMFEDGDGDVAAMDIKEGGSEDWLSMAHVWGATWSFNGGPLQGPLSVKITTYFTNSTLVATNVIPANWSPTSTYAAVGLNFKT